MAASARSVRPESPQDRDKTPQAGAVSLLPATKRILEMIAAGAGLTDILTSLCAAGTREFVLAQGIRAQWSQPLLSKDNEGLGTFGLFHGTPRSPTGRQLRLIEDAANIAVIAIEGERSQAALKQALHAVETSEQRLRTILDTIPTQAWCLRADGSLAYLNQRWHEYTGLSREEVCGCWKGEPGRAATGNDLAEAVNHPDDSPSALAKWHGWPPRQHGCSSGGRPGVPA